MMKLLLLLELLLDLARRGFLSLGLELVGLLHASQVLVTPVANGGFGGENTLLSQIDACHLADVVFLKPGLGLVFEQLLI